MNDESKNPKAARKGHRLMETKIQVEQTMENARTLHAADVEWETRTRLANC
jgi:hypothetical protein